MKYKKWLNEWYTNYVLPSSKSKTYETYSAIIEKRLIPKFGELEICEITPHILQSFVAELLRSGNKVTGKGLAANSVNTVITVIQNSLKLAYMLGESKEYAADKVKRPKKIEKSVSCFTLQEQKKIEKAALNAANSKYFGIVLCLYSGLRIGELFALTWADVDFEKGYITVNKTCHDGKNKNGKYCRITEEPKTDTSKRVIPLPKQIFGLLRGVRKNAKSEWIICSNKGSPISVRSYQNTFSLLLKRISVPRRGFHSLRQTFATRALSFW